MENVLRVDLLEAQANVDWVWGRLPDLAKRLDEWLDRSVTTKLHDPGGDSTHNLIIGVEKELLPLSFNVEVGAYINVIRSSLDVLDPMIAGPEGGPSSDMQRYEG